MSEIRRFAVNEPITAEDLNALFGRVEKNLPSGPPLTMEALEAMVARNWALAGEDAADNTDAEEIGR